MKKPQQPAIASPSITRRKALAAVGSVAASLTVSPEVRSAPGVSTRTAASANKSTAVRAGEWTRLRRVVTSDDAEGHGVVLADGEPGNSIVLSGTRITRLWETGAVPVPLPLKADAGVTAGNAYRAGFQGTSFYIAELPGGTQAPSIPMHQNATVDYMAILSGRIVLRIEHRDIDLKAGDTIIQGGNMHTWINRWHEPCLLLFVVITGARAPA